uniref:Uncharacterized protein n=1 Tax=Setaria italica TaxID=4555 RepID=K3YF40_SETIT
MVNMLYQQFVQGVTQIEVPALYYLQHVKARERT